MSQLALLYQAQSKQSIQSQPIPEPTKGHVQVRVEAAAVNPFDFKIYDYGFNVVKKYPTVLGCDAAGEVTKIGPDVAKFNVGDRVTFVCLPNFEGGANNGERGAFQQYALADVQYTAKIPASVDYDSASTFAGAGMTAARALYDELKLTAPWFDGEGAYKGEKIVILGGSSSVGSYAIQYAALSGFDVIATSSPAHFDYLKSLGASAVIDRSAADAAAQILLAAGGPVKYVLDSVSLPSTQLLGVDILQPKGILVLELQSQPPTKEAADAKDITISARMGLWFNESQWDTLEGLLERGVFKFNRPTVLAGGLHAWEEAFDLHRQGKVSGTKVVMRPQETKQVS
ncbi:chaperonin 10-like protein [Mycena maculata]|uniref:Chaperonin 10-like protein n=1 Tax=Mycena maculata TaxID=230809 RepID=A0AAD7N465_9AGAR|nr:chaperonin 10-like protein [Mycena maculata]